MAQYHKTPELSVSSVFKLRPDELQLFFLREHTKKPDNIGERRECLAILEKVDWNRGLLDSLASDAETGIIGDVKDLQRRRKFFGVNEQSLPTIRSFWSILWDQMDEFYIVLLLVLATVLLGLSFISDENMKWVESVSVYAAVFFALCIQTLCDWGKEKQFLRLRKEIENQNVTVLRGQYGTTQRILASELVVGDVIMLEAGDRIPADCFLIEEMDMFVDQSEYALETSQDTMVEKQCSSQDASKDENNPDPVLFANSIVMQGSGKAVVLCVGKKTLREIELGSGEERDAKLKIVHPQTPLQEKLTVLSEIIGTWAQIIAWSSLFVFGIVWLITVIFTSDMDLLMGSSLSKLAEFALIAVALLVVCIPEGMPLVVSMAMAFSIDSLKSQNLLIKNLDALETAGQLIDILTGKTATLTTGDMEVNYLYIKDTEVPVADPQVNEELLSLLHNCCILNTDANMQMDENKFIAVGNPVDVALMNMLITHEKPVQDMLIQRERQCELLCSIPFNSFRKVKTVCYRVPGEMTTEGNEVARIVIKGAPENVISNCVAQTDSNGYRVEFNQFEKFDMLDNVIDVKIARFGKPISIAYRDMPVEQFEELMRDNGNFETEESRVALESDLTLVASVGLKDDLREGVVESVKKLWEANTNVRIVSGDHRESAVAVARDLGLFQQDDVDDNVISGEELKDILSKLMKETIDTEEGRGKTYVFVDEKVSVQEFKQNVLQFYMVVYRADPEVKHMLTAAIRQSGSIVGVTGEGLNDARALSEASVGFAMGEDGCAAAKDHSDIILTDDNFVSVVNAIRWGRNIQDNTRKFIQYQMTVNISCLTFVILSILTLGFSPFSVFQLLWINLVMDVLAAIAFATEHPHPTELKKERSKKKDKIITPLMWRACSSQVLYQLIVMITLLYGAPAMFDIKYPFYPSKALRTDEGLPTFRLQHQTLLFQTFMMMNLFNMFNCRVLGRMADPKKKATEESALVSEDNDSEKSRREMNIFTRLWDNKWFLIVLLAEANLQFFMVQTAAIGVVLLTTPLTLGMHLTAFFLGAGSLGVAALVKLTPEKWLKKFPSVQEDEKALKKSKGFVSKADAFVALE